MIISVSGISTPSTVMPDSPINEEHCGNEVRLEAIRKACKDIDYKKPTSDQNLRDIVEVSVYMI